MTESSQSVWMLASTTAAIGMGVVFVALFLLSVYMHYFKVFIARVEARHALSQPAAKKRVAPAAPRLDPVPGAAPAEEDGARVAAAIAVGLRLHGAGGAPSGEVAAAIATALTLQRARVCAALPSVRSAAPWQMAGRLEMMAARVRRQER
ncbi:MAG: OadG family protein [Deferrisomatales bacterium]|nr:OadG family protein [Deferrisomatales bacterium]